jgi:uncharacterized membrane protein
VTGRALLGGNFPWMAWNTFLALVPLGLALSLFGAPGGRPWRRPLWWLGVGAFIAFLPNSPYVLTDLIHLPNDAAATPSERLELALVAQYGLYFAVGFGAYVLAIRRLTQFVSRAGWSRRSAMALVVAVQAVCAAGVYVGRVLRWNSWDLVAQPTALASDVRASVGEPLTFVAVVFVFVVLTVGVVTALAVIDEIAGHVTRRREHFRRTW